MVHDTSKDPRLLVAELALAKLGKYLFSKSSVRAGMKRNEAREVLSHIESQIMALKYCYMEPGKMAKSEMTTGIVEDVKRIYIAFRECIEKGMTEVPQAKLFWAFRLFSGLPNRFKNQGVSISSGIDLVAVQIRNIKKSGKLFTTRCMAGPAEFTIVTNIEGLKAGDTVGAALLPPAVVGGVVSEAMFLGGEKYDKEPGAFLDEAEVNTKEADGILFTELRKNR